MGLISKSEPHGPRSLFLWSKMTVIALLGYTNRSVVDYIWLDDSDSCNMKPPYTRILWARLKKSPERLKTTKNQSDMTRSYRKYGQSAYCGFSLHKNASRIVNVYYVGAKNPGRANEKIPIST